MQRVYRITKRRRNKEQNENVINSALINDKRSQSNVSLLTSSLSRSSPLTSSSSSPPKDEEIIIHEHNKVIYDALDRNMRMLKRIQERLENTIQLSFDSMDKNENKNEDESYFFAIHELTQSEICQYSDHQKCVSCEVDGSQDDKKIKTGVNVSNIVNSDSSTTQITSQSNHSNTSDTLTKAETLDVDDKNKNKNEEITCLSDKKKTSSNCPIKITPPPSLPSLSFPPSPLPSLSFPSPPQPPLPPHPVPSPPPSFQSNVPSMSLRERLKERKELRLARKSEMRT